MACQVSDLSISRLNRVASPAGAQCFSLVANWVKCPSWCPIEMLMSRMMYVIAPETPGGCQASRAGWIQCLIASPHSLCICRPLTASSTAGIVNQRRVRSSVMSRVQHWITLNRKVTKEVDDYVYTLCRPFIRASINLPYVQKELPRCSPVTPKLIAKYQNSLSTPF